MDMRGTTPNAKQSTAMKGNTMKNEILNALRTFGWQPTSALSFAFGSEFATVIKKLHNEGKVVKHRNGWKAA